MPWVDDANAALLTDLYELTMAASYFAEGMDREATFDLFVRRLPPQRNFLIACGLDDALDFLESFHFSDAALGYLNGLGMFEAAFLQYLAKLRFTGSVRAMEEGEAVFADEPLLSVTAPLIQAQLVETFLLNCITFQTLIASKAARVAIACAGRPFVDFGARRMHGADAALKAPRASYIGGAAATSSVVAGQQYGIPVSGTMAHSYVLAFAEEEQAFRAYVKAFPGNVTLLLDTYDVYAAARRVVELANSLPEGPAAVQAVRLDSGDLLQQARQVRRILDEGGCSSVRIFASGDLDEYRIAELLAAGAPIDAFGVGTQLGTSADAPSLGGVYKLVEYAGSGRRKLSPGKATLPGRKQVFRREREGFYEADVVAAWDEDCAGRPLLAEVMREGRRLEGRRPLEELRERCRRTLQALPPRLLSLLPAETPYGVSLSPGLQAAAGQPAVR